MAQSLEEYIAQSTNAYQPASNAIQSQIDALNGRLETTNQQINRNYAQQQAGLNRARNAAAETASMQAAGSGGSFGGAANLANRKHYAQTFVPAVTQLQTNQANDLASARQSSEDQRTNLNAQMANLQAQANQQALAQYYSDQQLEKQLAVQRSQIAAQNAANAQSAAQNAAMLEAAKKTFSLSNQKNIYGGYDWTDATGQKHMASTVASGRANWATSGDDFNDSLYQVLAQAANHGQGDYYSQVVADEMNYGGARFAKNTSGQSTGNAMYDTLGIYRVN